ncbi:MAG: hypothetical protein A2787_04890 [Omnitrophica WOR_2 bacterium RIFCSPHIGHO2_01_FULL_48_9]|nr:MAG: hypothetical protein A3D10_03485 [Omnitrophica WOR_2 bacterium RIFCSPHIGHO2_02_FULL_48_11]OGX33051.1 MAG: hypothetical protein A2787_04890 [Omnitrophica WOR_2 bacterium RIFCSPHIGHO2_01_FULL_48_9]
MKKYLLILMACFFASCSYLNNPETLLQDPHYAAYKDKSDALGHEYLQGKIAYPEYLERKKQLDDNYSQEVQDRNAKIAGEQ